MTVIKSTEYVDLENTRDSKMKMKEEDKDMDNQFEWVEFYKAFAEELLQYKDKRNELIQIIRCWGQNIMSRHPLLSIVP